MQQMLHVGYYRVSTERQGRSGLGLEAQRTAVLDYLNDSQGHLLGEFTEVESGRRKDRPQLKMALDQCRRQRAVLVIAKLDRLARNVAFISALLESKVRFIAVDMPEADVTFLQMAAVFGEWEAKKISERTKAALAAAKARGKRLGWSMPSRCAEQKEASKRGAATNHQRSVNFAKNIIPIIDSVRKAGVTTLSGIASALNARGVSTARNARWHATSVRNILAYCSEKSLSSANVSRLVVHNRND
ncbi:MAG: recombinase family protein [Terriglobia bacterium]|nr:recombinase family protein [Terriglobia bacterium]